MPLADAISRHCAASPYSLAAIAHRESPCRTVRYFVVSGEFKGFLPNTSSKSRLSINVHWSFARVGVPSSLNFMNVCVQDDRNPLN